MKEKMRGKFRNGKILRKLARALVGFRPQLSAVPKGCTAHRRLDSFAAFGLAAVGFAKGKIM